jgi:hypothetical protein
VATESGTFKSSMMGERAMYIMLRSRFVMIEPNDNVRIISPYDASAG